MSLSDADVQTPTSIRWRTGAAEDADNKQRPKDNMNSKCRRRRH